MSKRRWPKIHQEALERFTRIQAATWDDRTLSLNDRLFCDVAGQQWAGLVDEEDQRPHLELNKTQGAVIRLEGEHRNNRCTVSFLPKDGSPKTELADALDGLYRADEQDSFGDEAYDNAFGDQVRGGYGAWRLRTQPADPDDESNDEQRIALEPIVDPETSVYYDLDCKQQNKSDARFCFVLSTITPQEYRRLYGDDPASWPDAAKTAFIYSQDWFTPDVVTIAEYYVVKREPEKWLVFKSLDGEEFEKPAEDFEPDDDDAPEEGEGPKALRELLALGNTLVGEKMRKPRRVTKYTMSGAKILNEEAIAGNYIPVVVVYGKRTFVRNKERWSGHVRLAKDAQRVLNALTSWLLEIAAQTTAAVPIFAPEQIIGHQDSWVEHASGKPKAFLTAEALRNQDGTIATAPGPIGYTKPPELPPALAAMLQFIGIDLKELLGSQEQGDKMVSNISGKAVEMIQRHLDSQTEIYLDNFAKGMHYSGVVWNSMAREVYVEENRRLKTVGVDRKSRGTVTIAEPGLSEAGKVMLDGVIDLSSQDFDVVVDVGPSSENKRAAVARENAALLAITPPELVKAREVVMMSILANIQGEGLTPIQEWAQMELVKLGVGKPTDDQKKKLAEEQAAAQNAPPDPQKAALEAQTAALAASASKEQALALKAEADRLLSLAKVAQAEADTALKKAEALRVVTEVDMDTAGIGREPVAFEARRN